MTFFDSFIDTLTKNSPTDYLVSIIIILAFTIIGPALSSFLLKLFHVKEKRLLRIKRHAFYKPLKSFFSLLGIYIALRTLTLPDKFSIFIEKTFRILTIILIANATSNLFSSNSHNYERIQKLFNFTGNDALLGFVSKIIKVIIYIIAGFIIVNELGYDLSGIVAGLGIFSAVIALAAQDLAKNIIAGCSIITDKPFDVGDFIELNTLTGTVEDITFRSIRIRNVENQVIVVPNSIISTSTLINYTKMQKRRYFLTLTLEHSTDLNKVLELLEKIKSLLFTHQNVLQDNIKVFFQTVSSNGFDITIDFYTDIIDYTEYLQFKQEMNYELLDLINKEDIKIAHNPQTVYLKNIVST